jgi:hypothetical protein
MLWSYTPDTLKAVGQVPDIQSHPVEFLAERSPNKAEQ